MSAIGEHVRQYLQLRRGLGFKLGQEGRLLDQFAGWLEAAGEVTITAENALAWATAPQDADPCWWRQRLAAVRPFARYLSAFVPGTQVPPRGLLPGPSSRRAVPWIYTPAEITALTRAAAAFSSPLRAATCQTLIGLLAVTGMRAGEAISLDRGSLDTGQGLLAVHGKNGKTRQLPLHPSTVRALAGYGEVRDRHMPRPATPALFVSLAGTRLIYKNVHRTFHQLTRDAGLMPRSASCRPRIHDLRHTFAVTTLAGWYRDGGDVAARMPLLSTWLGHASPADTYWYLTGTPELLTLAAARLEPPDGQTR